MKNYAIKARRSEHFTRCNELMLKGGNWRSLWWLGSNSWSRWSSKNDLVRIKVLENETMNITWSRNCSHRHLPIWHITFLFFSLRKWLKMKSRLSFHFHLPSKILSSIDFAVVIVHKNSKISEIFDKTSLSFSVAFHLIECFASSIVAMCINAETTSDSVMKRHNFPLV